MIWKTGRLLIAVLSIGVVVPTFTSCAQAAGDEEENEVKVQLEDCPQAVQRTIKKEAGSGKIVEIEKEREGGKVVYEAEVIIDGKEYEVTVAEDGNLLGKEEEGADDDDTDDDDGNADGVAKKA